MMLFVEMISVTCILLGLASMYIEALLISPCPNIFKYRNNGVEDYATVSIPPPGPGPVKLEVVMSVRGRDKERQGLLYLRESNEDSRNNILEGKKVEYMLTFPKSLIPPYLTSIKLNNVVICIGNHNYGDTLLAIRNSFEYKDNYLTFNSYYGPKIKKNNAIAESLCDRKKVNFKFSDMCGISPTKLKSRRQGVGVQPGEYPWLVELYHFEATKEVPKCGGTLVSDIHVITAAHCVLVEKIHVKLGLHDMRHYKTGQINRNVVKVHTHPDYRKDTGIGDIAILEMDKKVTFTENIMPACIWPYYTCNSRDRGYVVGWGANAVIPRQAVVTMIDQKICRAKDEFHSITSDITFCADAIKQGPCGGDSGSGMYIPYQRKWYLRGIISTSVSQTIGSCDVGQISVFADVAKLVMWIKQYID